MDEFGFNSGASAQGPSEGHEQGSAHSQPKMRDKLPTERQLMVLRFIAASVDTRGYPPTLREIGAHMRIGSTNGVNDHLRMLEKKQLIAPRPFSKSRSIVLTDNGRAFATGYSDVQGRSKTFLFKGAMWSRVTVCLRKGV